MKKVCLIVMNVHFVSVKSILIVCFIVLTDNILMNKIGVLKERTLS